MKRREEEEKKKSALEPRKVKTHVRELKVTPDPIVVVDDVVVVVVVVDVTVSFTSVDYRGK